MVYVQRRGQGYFETVDEVSSWRKARRLLREYRMSDPSAVYYLPWLLLGYGPAWWAAERLSPGPDGSSLADRLPERFLVLQDAKAAGRGGRVVRVRPW